MSIVATNETLDNPQAQNLKLYIRFAQAELGHFQASGLPRSAPNTMNRCRAPTSYFVFLHASCGSCCAGFCLNILTLLAWQAKRTDKPPGPILSPLVCGPVHTTSAHGLPTESPYPGN